MDKYSLEFITNYIKNDNNTNLQLFNQLYSDYQKSLLDYEQKINILGIYFYDILKILTHINLKINAAKHEANEQIKKTISSLQDEVSSQLSTLDDELEKKILESEKEIVKNRESQINEINKEITNITKITISKITNINFSDEDIKNAIKSYKGILN